MTALLTALPLTILDDGSATIDVYAALAEMASALKTHIRTSA